MKKSLFRSIPRSFIASLILTAFLSIQPTLALGALDNKGTEFLMAFLPNYEEEPTPSDVEIHLTSDVATEVTIEYPVNTPSFTTTVSVTPGDVTVVSLPTEVQSWEVGVVEDNAVRASSDNEFVAYLINREDATSDAALALPVDTMNTEYIINAPTPTSWESDFAVVAAFDTTEVTITPTAQLSTGQAAEVPFTVTLNRGEGVQFRSELIGGAGDLSGTIIESNRPIGMINGLDCVNIGGQGFCDHVFEVAQPVQTWGTEVLVANLPLRDGGSIYRIVASQDETVVSQDGGVLTTLNRGQYYTTPALPGSHQFSADKPIFVTQWMTGQPSGGTGDPAFGNVIPFAQFLPAYTFSTVGGDQFAQNFVTIIAEDSDVGTLTLDGVPVLATEFTPIGGTGYSSAVLPLESGAHTTASTGVHGITVEGYDSFDSYLYPGGALFEFINSAGDDNAPVVTIMPDTDTAIKNGLAEDNKPSEDINENGVLDPGEDLNGNELIDEDTGIFSIQLEAGAINLTLAVDPFIPGDASATFKVQHIDTSLDASGTITVTDGAGNVTTTEISFVAASQVIEGIIDIKPYRHVNRIHINIGVIPVAILGSSTFDVSSIDVSTLSFGPNAAPRIHKLSGHLYDINRDGHMDLMSYYLTRQTGISKNDTEACIQAYTNDGTEFVGCDSIVTSSLLTKFLKYLK